MKRRGETIRCLTTLPTCLLLSSTLPLCHFATSERDTCLPSQEHYRLASYIFLHFCLFWQHLNKLENNEHLYRAFQVFDRDGNGYITEAELLESLTVIAAWGNLDKRQSCDYRLKK
jgi:hypothetical protein